MALFIQIFGPKGGGSMTLPDNAPRPKQLSEIQGYDGNSRMWIGPNDNRINLVDITPNKKIYSKYSSCC